ncbi:glycerol-3-phosphate dehydrogenase/oxidase [Alkalihalobacillus sp. 1P02AB]|uniref:glycerol-3-phosphate dehydrogenase/oxidase n=1 Tax=Alkalihalobacillus sp. 1P02AB TaxID=3132260 RepID=UPI0039A5362A
MNFSNLQRESIKQQLKEVTLDVLIIGGGITGAGIALDASSRGMKAGLIEMQDFASGTSSRSTKLVHGGLRYLKQFEVKMVAEVGKERAVVYENGPHVTTPEWMLLPIHKGGTFGKFSTSIGLRVYDFLAGVKKAERRSMLSINETLKKEPLVKSDGLKGGGYYVEYRTDDARLTLEVMKAAHQKGAIALNYSKADELLYKNSQLVGVVVRDELTGEHYEVYAKKIVNASGPWVDTIRQKDGSKEKKSLKLTKGVHIVIDQSKFPMGQAVYFDTPDKRMVFAIPRDGKVYVGTTDTFFEDDPIDPKMTDDDRTYLLEAIKFMFPSVSVGEEDVESSWAGVRPLIWEEGKDPSEISRKDEIWRSKSGLITIAGGKLTGYRKMAEMIVDLLAKELKEETNKEFSACVTKNIPISGGDVGGSKGFQRYKQEQVKIGMMVGLKREEAEHLVSLYGSNSPILFKLVKNDGKEEAARYQLPVVLWAKLKYAIDYEMAATPIDFFNRRTGAILFDIATVGRYKNNIIDYLANQFLWKEEKKEFHLQELEKAIKQTTEA